MLQCRISRSSGSPFPAKKATFSAVNLRGELVLAEPRARYCYSSPATSCERPCHCEGLLGFFQREESDSVAVGQV